MDENQNLAMRNMVSNETEDGSGSVSELLEVEMEKMISWACG